MSTQSILEYLSKLLNKPITPNTEIALSSAQKSRLHGWLINNGIAFNEATLARKFTVEKLLFGGIREEAPQLRSKDGFLSSDELSAGIFKIGVDIQRVDELFPQGLSSDPKTNQELSQIFTAKELSYAQSKPDTEATLTGIFCAKEAIQKISSISKKLNEIEVLPDEDGTPKSNGYLLSISHSGNYAIAIACLATQKYTDINPKVDSFNKTSETKDIPGLGLRLIDYVLMLLVSIALILTFVRM